jgi:hypothetical protein
MYFVLWQDDSRKEMGNSPEEIGNWALKGLNLAGDPAVAVAGNAQQNLLAKVDPSRRRPTSLCVARSFNCRVASRGVSFTPRVA